MSSSLTDFSFHISPSKGGFLLQFNFGEEKNAVEFYAPSPETKNEGVLIDAITINAEADIDGLGSLFTTKEEKLFQMATKTAAKGCHTIGVFDFSDGLSYVTPEALRQNSSL